MGAPRPVELSLIAAAALDAFGSHLSHVDQIWLAHHLGDLPAFFRSPDGSELANMLVAALREHVNNHALV